MPSASELEARDRPRRSGEVFSRSCGYGSIVLQGKAQPEARAGAKATVYLDAPSGVLRVLHGLEHANPHAVSFGTLKRPEEALPHERLAHAASRIGDLDDRVLALSAVADAHLPRLLGGVDGVLHQVPENALEALLVADGRHRGIGGLHRDVRACRLLRRDDPFDHLGKPHRTQALLAAATSGEL